MAPRETRAVRVLLTGVGGGGQGEQVLKALRIAETPYEIVGTDVTPYSSGLGKVDHPVIVPPATAPEYVDVLLEVAAEYRAEVLIHGSEPELRQMSEHRERFIEAGLFLPINPAEVIETCMDKLRTMKALEAAGFEVPPYRSVRSLDDLEDFDELPAVLKPSLGGGGSAHLYLAQDRDELLSCAEQILSVHSEFIVQAYVGTPDHEYTVGVLLDMDGQLLNSIAVRREIMTALSNRIKVPNRTGRRELSSMLAISSGISQGRVGPFPEVCERCEEIAAALDARGPLNIQCRLVEGEVVVFEINPRFSGTTSLRALAGYNEPDVLIRKHVLGETIEPRFPYRECTIVRGLAETVIPEGELRRAVLS